MSRSSHPHPTAAPLDLRVLRRATGGDRDLMQELAALYVSDADLQMRALADAVASEDLERLRRIVRVLGRTSESVGARAAARAFQRFARAAAEGERAAFAGLLEDARSAFRRARRALVNLR